MEAVRGLGEFAPAEVGVGKLRAFGLRMRVWWEKDRLTRQLARGAASVDSRELALRAGQITAKRTRDVVADSIGEVLDRAAHPSPLFSSQAPIDRAKVHAARHELSDLVQRLREPEPVRAQGMAQLLLLLTDPEQALWGIGTVDELVSVIIEVKQRLDAPALEVTS